MEIKFGTTEGSFNPRMPDIINSGATLCTGYAGYIMKIAETYTELVKILVPAKDPYSPIVLTGVVEGDTNYSTNLLCVVALHLPYMTINNSPTSLRISIRENVSVTCTIGMSFIKATKLVINTNDNVAERKLLAKKPFEILYK